MSSTQADERCIVNEKPKLSGCASDEDKASLHSDDRELEVKQSSSTTKNVSERQLLQKIDLRIIPVLCVLYVLSFLDRVNIGNAAIFGLKEDLNLTGDQFNTALVIFFAPFVLFEVPSNILLKRFKPHMWLSGCLFTFGVITICQGLTQNFGGLLAARFFLGVFESGMLPGCLYLMSMWYKRDEAQKRFTFLFSACTLAGAFGGLIASGIGKMDGVRGLLGWRWVFIIEGLITCIAAPFFYFLLPDFPEASGWLSSEEKAFLRTKLRTDVDSSDSREPLTLKRTIHILSDYKVILGGFQYFGLVVTAYSIVYFFPTIIHGYGYGSIKTQLLSVPPYACAFVVGMLLSAVSDYVGHRFLFALCGVCTALAGFAILSVVHNNTNLQYFALFLVASGNYTAMPVVLCWFSMNVRGHIERGISIGWQFGFGGIGGFISSYAFLAKDAPTYKLGYSLCISFQCVSALAIILYFVAVFVENRRADTERPDAEATDDSESIVPFRYYT